MTIEHLKTTLIKTAGAGGEAMNLDELTKLEAAMTPGPWAEDPRCEGIIGGDNRSLLRADSDGYAECWREEDTAGIVALRNAAPALIECARLLQEFREAVKTVDTTRSGGAVWRLSVSPELFVKTAAALARLPPGWRCVGRCTSKANPEPWCDNLGGHL